MPYHAQGFRCVTRDQNILQCASKWPTRLRWCGVFQSPRALDKHSTMFFQLLRDSYLFRICGLAQKDVSVGLITADFRLVCFHDIWNRDSSPTMFRRDQGKSSRVRRSARIPSIAAA